MKSIDHFCGVDDDCYIINEDVEHRSLLWCPLPTWRLIVMVIVMIMVMMMVSRASITSVVFHFRLASTAKETRMTAEKICLAPSVMEMEEMEHLHRSCIFGLMRM